MRWKMEAKSVRRYHRSQAKSVADSLGRIIKRLNPRYTPAWLFTELYNSYHTAQCIQQERERDMLAFKEAGK